MRRDPYGISRAVRPWSGVDPAAAINARDTQEAVDRCLSCTMPQEHCKGDCTSMTKRAYVKKLKQKPRRPVTVPTADPCPTCHSRKLCDGIGGTCGDKVRWVGRVKEGTR